MPSVAAWAAARSFQKLGQDEDEGLDVFGLGGAGGGSGEFAKLGDAEFVALACAEEEDALGGYRGGREQPDGLGEFAGEVSGGDQRRGQGSESRIGGEQLRRREFCRLYRRPGRRAGRWRWWRERTGKLAIFMRTSLN